jgi:LemA protein
MEILIIIIIVLILALIAVAFIYNRFIKLQVRSDEAWADIDVQLKRRYDLIPNLINTVKGYAQHESSTFQQVTEARNMAINASSVAEQQQAENMLTGALKSLFAVSEAYPDLKANENFLELQRELSDTENKIQAARRFYNTVVRDLNTMVKSFPSNLVASLFSFQTREYFELDEDSVERENVQVQF